jgi:NADH-quinone oxidoreductase subunit N
VAVVLASVISAGYYLYVVMVMFMRPRPADLAPPAPVPGVTRFVIGATAAALLVFGIYPTPVLRFAARNTLPVSVSAAPAAPSAGVPPSVAPTR